MKLEKTTRVLVVEDSALVGDILKHVIEKNADMEVVGIAKDGLEGVALAKELKPDLITMDIVMPKLDGIEATKIIMENIPTPIVIISGEFDEEVYSTFKALEAGALAIIQKPKNIESEDFKKTENYITETIRSMAAMRVTKRRPKSERSRRKIDAQRKDYNEKYDVLALGCSTGGPSALKSILSSLPDNFSLPILIVQHIGIGFDVGLAYWLNQYTKLNVKIAEDNEKLVPGTVYVSPNEVHMAIKKRRVAKDYVIDLQDAEVFEGFKPSINVLFDSLASLNSRNIIAGLLTGMGSDGAKGLLNLRKQECCTFAQDEQSSVIFGMPKTAIYLEAAKDVVPLEEIPLYIMSQVSSQEGEP